LALAAAVSAKQIPVKVGETGLTFSPNDFTADIGDEVVFSYYPKNHTVTQSSFAKPCVPLAGGFFSGFVPTASGVAEKTFTIKVTAKSPIWFYCSQVGGAHCAKGMVGGININQESKNTLAAFKELAAATNGSITDLVPAGGVVSNNVALPPSNTTASASGSASTSSYTKTTVISTVGTSTASSAYTTNGVVYTSGQAVPYTTVYTTTSTGASVIPASATSAAPSTSSSVAPNAAAGSLSGGLFAGAAAILGALAMI